MPTRERRARTLGISLDQLPDRRHLTEKERFFGKVEKTDGCWLWMGATNKWGYGNFHNAASRTELAHRASWRLTYGEDAGELRVCHHCDNPQCVNPTHLFLGSDADNVADQVAKGRQPRSRGERNGRAKLTDAQVAELRDRYKPGVTRIVDLAAEFGITYGHVWQLVSGKKRQIVEHNGMPGDER
ncbi:HNH endonuclease [Novosphingobium sp.]|uniref:HNH endonuclease n=1 Tax=Novosphingobium sp. TaxID=1874826 RepID=UPI00352AAE72